MKTEIINKKVVSFESVTTTKPVTVYIADDGKEFESEAKCMEHERKLLAIERGKHLFKEITLTDEQQTGLLKLCFGGYGSLDDVLIVWYKATRNPDDINKAIGYLYARGFNNVKGVDLSVLEEGKQYIIASWTEDSFSDRPSYDGRILELESVSNSINELRNKIVEIKFELE